MRQLDLRRRLRRFGAVALITVTCVIAAGCGTWRADTSASFARQEVSYVYAPSTGKFYLGGGRSEVQQAYDPRTRSWTTVAPLPAALDHIQSVVLNDRIYYIGGLIGWPAPAVGTVYIYDPSTNTFSTGAPMPSSRKRGAGGVAVHGGKIYYAGGLYNGAAVNWFDEYDPTADTWRSLKDMPEARDHFQAAVVGDRFYAIGGRNTAINATTTVNDAYDFGSESWVTGLAPLPTPRGGFAAAAIGTTIFLIGGEGGGRTYPTVEGYDTGTNRWTRYADMPTARHGIEAAICNGAIYIADGGTKQGGGAPTAIQEMFSPSGGTGC